MSQERWTRVSELFEAALQCPAAEREGFLQELCGKDHELLRAVRKLLEADSEAEDFMEKPLVRVTETPEDTKDGESQD